MPNFPVKDSSIFVSSKLSYSDDISDELLYESLKFSFIIYLAFYTES